MTWISVLERLPEPEHNVLVLLRPGREPVGRDAIQIASHRFGFWTDRDATDLGGEREHYMPGTVTHWMPLPAPPADRVAQPIDVDDDENDEKPLRCDRCRGEDFLWCDAFYPDRRVSRHVCQRCGNTASTVTQWHTQQPQE